jgi:ribonuclease HI
LLSLRKKKRKKNPLNLIMPLIDYEITWGYFDGESQGHPPMCGVGIIIFINHNHYLFIKYSPRVGSNNRAKFISLWMLLEITKSKDVRKLQVMADSKLAID